MYLTFFAILLISLFFFGYTPSQSHRRERHPGMSESIGPFFNCKEAADFCGYSHSYFEKMVNRFKIKRYGPSKNRFARADLEAFMASPERYATGAAQKTRRPITLEV